MCFITIAIDIAICSYTCIHMYQSTYIHIYIRISWQPNLNMKIDIARKHRQNALDVIPKTTKMNPKSPKRIYEACAATTTIIWISWQPNLKIDVA